ncbi:MAG: response regulator [Polyangiaceae bacterium]|nr:response regulator [Polyangiaceae bacterium]
MTVPNPKHCHVLVVDDNPIDCRLARGLLEKDGAFVTRGATDGRSALRQAEEEAPDIVVTDLQMPKMDGLELVRELRTLYPQTPVVLMTAYGSEDVAVQALRAGAADYVPKRNLSRELARTVASIWELASTADRHERAFSMLEQSDAKYRLGLEMAPVADWINLQEWYLRSAGICDAAEALQVGVALREAIHNAIYHGNLALSSELREPDPGAVDKFESIARLRREQPPYNQRRVTIKVQQRPDSVRYVITDCGSGFDPATLPEPLAPANLARSFGRGLLLIRTFMDEVHHNDVGNEITMVKRRGGAAPLDER